MKFKHQNSITARKNIVKSLLKRSRQVKIVVKIIWEGAAKRRAMEVIDCSGNPNHLHLNQKALQVAPAKLKNGRPTQNIQMRPRVAAGVH